MNSTLSPPRSRRSNTVMDVFSREQRSQLMRSIRTSSTGPEVLLRSELHKLGYRYVVNSRKLPGTPDLVFPSRRAVIFIHGCFWHGHKCPAGKLPATNTEFWTNKIEANTHRDQRCIRELKSAGWKVRVVWECQLSPRRLRATLRYTSNFLDAAIKSARARGARQHVA